MRDDLAKVFADDQVSCDMHAHVFGIIVDNPPANAGSELDKLATVLVMASASEM